MKRQGIEITPIKSGVNRSSIFMILAALRPIRHCLSVWMKMIGLGGHVKLRPVS
jgi:hypothetical protein